MTVTLQPVWVATGAEKEGMLVFADERLVAVLVRLSAENEIAPGAWYLETGFGRHLDGPDHPIPRPRCGAGMDRAALGALSGPAEASQLELRPLGRRRQPDT
jgi:hypothetical protein